MDVKYIINSTYLYDMLTVIDITLKNFEDSDVKIPIYREVISSLKKELTNVHVGENIKIKIKNVSEKGD